MNFDSTRVKIDLDAISANFDAIAAKAKVPVMAVVKADAYGHGAIQVARLLQPYGFAVVMGKQDGFPIKPDPASLHHLMARLGATPGESLYIGDSDVDIQLGKAAGVATLGVTWGFRGEAELTAAGADFLCSNPDTLGALILNL